MNNWYVFQVQTGKEQVACDFLNKLFVREESCAFIPQVEIVIKRSDFIHKKLKPMFPGYVFTESILEEKLFVNNAYKYVKFSKSIINLLGNDIYIKLREDEKNFLLAFCNDEYVVGESKGVKIGDKVYITSGPLKGKESIIRKIDRHSRRAEIESTFLGTIRRINVSLEIVTKVLQG